MSIIAVVNRKGGVGKTALAVNGAHAFSKRFCETLVIDLDPQGDATSLLRPSSPPPRSERASGEGELFEKLVSSCLQKITPVRSSLSILSAESLASLLPDGKIETLAAHGELLPRLIEELSQRFDNVLLDTPPTVGALQDTAVRCADLLLIPVDPSEMSVRAAISLLQSCAADQGASPVAAMLIRTLVNKRATRIAEKSLRKLEQEFLTESSTEEDTILPPKRVLLKGLDLNASPLEIYLSHATLYRSELVHGLTYQGKTVFEHRQLIPLQDAYSRIARECEEVLSIAEPEEEVREDDFEFDLAFG
ncbi:ParA family protein [bacterium]|nr:ParA family protein [bacterium]